MGLSRTVSEINCDFRRKSQNFPAPMLRPCWRSSPWNWSAHGVKKLEWWSYRAEKEIWRYLQRCGYRDLEIIVWETFRGGPDVTCNDLWNKKASQTKTNSSSSNSKFEFTVILTVSDKLKKTLQKLQYHTARDHPSVSPSVRHQRDGRTERRTERYRATEKTALTHSVAR